MPAEVIVNAYKIMLNDRVKELQLEGVKKKILQRVTADDSQLFSVSAPTLSTSEPSVRPAGSSDVCSLFTVNSPVAPAVLNARAAKTFTSITGRGS